MKVQGYQRCPEGGKKEVEGGWGGTVRLSVAVKFDGVDGGGDGTTHVAAALLLGLFVAERLALGELEHVVGLLAPVPICSFLKP